MDREYSELLYIIYQNSYWMPRIYDFRKLTERWCLS